MSSDENLNSSENRILLFIDILGWKNRVREEPLHKIVECFGRVFDSLFSSMVRLKCRQIFTTGIHDLLKKENNAFVDTMKKYAQLAGAFKLLEEAAQRDVSDAFLDHTGFNVAMMSDSIIIYSDSVSSENSEFLECLSNLLIVSRIVMMKLFVGFLPSRGSIVYGELHADKINSVFLGKALVEAHDLAESQNWIGICTDETVAGYVNKLVGDKYAAFDNGECDSWFQKPLLRPGWDILEYDIPFKEGKRKQWAINWVTAFNGAGPIIDEFFDDVLTGDPGIDIKYQNTLTFMKHVHYLNSTRQLGLISKKQ